MGQRDIVVIAASRGGFQVLKNLVGELPGDLPAAVFVVLHIGTHGSALPDLMAGWGPLKARYAKHGDEVRRGTILVAPPDRHLVLSHGCAWLNTGPKEHFARPAADPLFRSAAEHYGRRVVGVVLSGDLDDGAAGLAAIRARGGFGIVQHPDDCESSAMPCNALDLAGADAVCPSAELARCIRNALQSASDDTAGAGSPLTFHP
ncbi:chemotaxis protein CheB [Caballeronia sp. BR00000012568055]|uniref:chemotaxis protein CheB n=1 Tax=Caballeronia sp. BR00000012568055 TaxID=2918761 RepID=UPI0023F839A1|nr:chemotaxis protein CheB [Caballeronia sp. BR00000012568055]